MAGKCFKLSGELILFTVSNDEWRVMMSHKEKHRGLSVAVMTTSKGRDHCRRYTNLRSTCTDHPWPRRGKGTVKTQPQSQHQLSSPSPETIGKWPAWPSSSIWDTVLERSTKQGFHQKIINPQHKDWKTASDVIKCGDPLPHQMPFSSPSSVTGGAQGCHTHKLAPWGALFWKGWS